MVIEARGDIVSLYGDLKKNLWQSIKATVHMLLKEHPNGIIIDCKDLRACTSSGVDTFVDAMRYINAHGSRVLLASVPEEVTGILKLVPNARSQLPIAATVEEARMSLSLQGSASGKSQVSSKIILVPVFQNLGTEKGIALACELAKKDNAQIHLVWFLEIPRRLPLGAPLPEEETLAKTKMQEAKALVAKYDCSVQVNVERTRDAVSAILEMASKLNASLIILSTVPQQAEDQEVVASSDHLVTTLLHKAPCEVVIERST